MRKDEIEREVVSVDGLWEPLKRGLLQIRLENQVQKYIPNLYVDGDPLPGELPYRFAFDWKKGTFTVWLPLKFASRWPQSVLTAVRLVSSRWPTMRVLIVVADGYTRYPKPKATDLVVSKSK